METRIRFCIVLDALGVFALIASMLSLIGSSLIPVDTILSFRWCFIGALALFGVARICEIARILWHTPNARSMRQTVARPALAEATPESRYPRAA